MKQVFINLPVKDVLASMDFYTQVGFMPNPLFTFDNQKCMVWSDHVYLMLQTHEMFAAGSRKSLPDTKQFANATFSLPVESPDRMNEIVKSAVKAGGKEVTPMIDEGFMQVRTIEDSDGHTWGILYLDIEKFKTATGK